MGLENKNLLMPNHIEKTKNSESIYRWSGKLTITQRKSFSSSKKCKITIRSVAMGMDVFFPVFIHVGVFTLPHLTFLEKCRIPLYIYSKNL